MRRLSFAAVMAAVVLAADPTMAQLAAAPTSKVQGRLQDLDAVRTRFLANDRSYAPAARRRAESRLDRLEARVETVTDAQFELALARIVALADNGHTRVLSGERSRRYNRVGVRLVPLGRDVVVLAARQELSGLLGAQLVAIEDQPAARLVREARQLSGGVPGFRDRSSPFLFESPDLLCAWGKIPRCDAALYRFRTPDGRVVSRRLAGEPPDKSRPAFGALRWLLLDPPADAGGPWRGALAEGCAPWSLRDPGEPFRWREAPDLDALVIDVRQNSSRPGRPLPDFLKAVEAEIDRRRPQNLVVDMRLNVGGDLNLTRAFMDGLPARVPGRIFVLTSPWTFSAGIASLGYLEQAAPERVTIVGEAVGDTLRFYAEGGPVYLSYSGVTLFNATQLHDYARGCAGEPICHGSIVRHPIRLRTLDPDIRAPWTASDYLAGRDPAMDAVRRELGRPKAAVDTACREPLPVRRAPLGR